MRISDWSSDVCSSDLRSVERPSPYDQGRSDQDHEERQGRAETRIVAEPVPPGAKHQRIALMPDGGKEIAARADGGRDQKGFWTIAEIIRRSEEHTSELQSLMRN